MICSRKIRGFETQSDKCTAQKWKTFYIWFLIILRRQICLVVLRDRLSDPMGFHQFSLQSRNLWHRNENVIFFIFIDDKIMF
jgi:hypothetical protein